MANVVGDWSITTDWGCDGSITGTFNQTFKADGTWTSSPFTHNGRWFQVEGVVAWTFDDVPHLVYSATLVGSWMVGGQGYEEANGIKGCFGAHRAGIPAAVAALKEKTKPGTKDPTLGK
jgi:hypothetical protein